MDEQQKQPKPKQRKGPGPGPRPPYKFTKEKREAYLELLRQGGRRHASARAVGITPDMVCLTMHADPEFASAVNKAEMEANEFVESALFQQTQKGNVTAIQVWLYNRDPARWKDQRKAGNTEALEQILDSLPAEFARGVRAAIAQALSGAGPQTGAAGAGPAAPGAGTVDPVPGTADAGNQQPG